VIFQLMRIILAIFVEENGYDQVFSAEGREIENDQDLREDTKAEKESALQNVEAFLVSAAKEIGIAGERDGENNFEGLKEDELDEDGYEKKEDDLLDKHDLVQDDTDEKEEVGGYVNFDGLEKTEEDDVEGVVGEVDGVVVSEGEALPEDEEEEEDEEEGGEAVGENVADQNDDAEGQREVEEAEEDDDSEVSLRENDVRRLADMEDSTFEREVPRVGEKESALFIGEEGIYPRSEKVAVEEVVEEREGTIPRKEHNDEEEEEEEEDEEADFDEILRELERDEKLEEQEKEEVEKRVEGGRVVGDMTHEVGHEEQESEDEDEGEERRSDAAEREESGIVDDESPRGRDASLSEFLGEDELEWKEGDDTLLFIRKDDEEVEDEEDEEEKEQRERVYTPRWKAVKYQGQVILKRYEAWAESEGESERVGEDVNTTRLAGSHRLEEKEEGEEGKDIELPPTTTLTTTTTSAPTGMKHLTLTRATHPPGKRRLPSAYVEHITAPQEHEVIDSQHGTDHNEPKVSNNNPPPPFSSPKHEPIFHFFFSFSFVFLFLIFSVKSIKE